MFKVMTLNINGYGRHHGPWPVRIGLIREVIEDACPDVIALQAVRKDPSQFEAEDQAEQLADLFNVFPYVLFQPGMRLPDGSADGVALVSRFELHEVSYLALPPLADSEDNLERVVLQARLDLTTGPIHLFNGTFSWVTKQAKKNIMDVFPFITSFSGPAMLVGDLNTPPSSELFEPFLEAGWTDVWADLYPEEDGFTFFESGSLVKRIDYAWVNPELKPTIRAIKIVAGDEAAIGARPSDHAGLLITLSVHDNLGKPC